MTGKMSKTYHSETVMFLNSNIALSLVAQDHIRCKRQGIKTLQQKVKVRDTDLQTDISTTTPSDLTQYSTRVCLQVALQLDHA